ncbi:ABC transporter permease DevC [Funiculus sociatus GB2-A5]|uniref:ABC transporter permease DevC n=1 Tax=Funiculus sociatus GB2-A5 TaxID=2933946 RepID=A0ABV0JI97_9CYAN|nr:MULTISPECIES: ABC transporter permease DevC [Cyanophyceae]MBD1922568.1 FtsX-like permease family protein [Microcoleus sp. FACHB-831]MBD2065653.1 FtsX-like permease family protein [Trichocoleus sp. FACHB-6]
MIGFQQLQRRTPLGWLQLSHQKGKLVVACAGVVFADVLMLMQLGFQGALFNSAVLVHNSVRADVVLISPQARNLTNMSSFPRRRLYQSMDIPGVQSAEALYANMVNWKHPTTQRETSMLMLGFDPNSSVFEQPDINQQLNSIKLPNTVLFDSGSRGDYKAAIAQLGQNQPLKTEIERHSVTIAGTIRIGSSFGADGHLITSDQNFLRLFPRRQASSVSVGLLQLQPGTDPVQTVQALKAHLPNDVQVLTRQEFIEFERSYWARNTPIGFIFNLGVTMGFIVGVIIVYQVLSTDVNAHMGEYATFKAMGYRNRYLLMVVFEEAVILAIIGFFPSVVISAGLYRLTRNATNLPLYMTLARGIFVLMLTMVMCTLSGAIATRKLQSADPADMF